MNILENSIQLVYTNKSPPQKFSFKEVANDLLVNDNKKMISFLTTFFEIIQSVKKMHQVLISRRKSNKFFELGMSESDYL